MKKILSLLLSLLICSSCFCSELAFATEHEEYGIGTNNTEFAQKIAEIIKDENDSSSMLRIIGRFSKKPSSSVFSDAEDVVISQDGRFALQFSTEQKLLDCLKKLSSNPNIIYAERDCEIYTESIEESEEFLSWGVEAIQASVYSETITPSSENSVTVAVIDSGAQNIDFIKDKLVAGYDFYENDDDAFEDESDDSHGTFLASIIADCTRNIPVKIMPVRVLKSSTGSLINAINGVYYAVDNGADVINISLCAAFSNCRSLEDAINYAEENDVTVVACAGNNKSDVMSFCPAHIESVLTVSSISFNFAFSESFSNFGDRIDLAAPGEYIIGHNADGEETAFSGTSMSTAFVAAAAAMFRLDNPNCNSRQVHNAIISATDDYGDTGWDKYYGWGVLNLGILAESDTRYVESVSFAQKSYSVYEGDTLEINPVFSPSDATNKSFKLSANNENVLINGNILTAVSSGSVTLTVTSDDGMYSDTVEITVIKKAPEIIAELKIKNNTGSKTINYGETLKLKAVITDKPENTAVWWYVNGEKAGEGETFEILPSKESNSITAKLVYESGEPVINSQGFEVSDSETVTVNSGFLQKLISFFKNLFRMNRTVVQFIFKG